MILLLVLATLLVGTVLVGGDLTRLGRIGLRHKWLPIVALAVQLVIIELVERLLPEKANAALHLASYAVIAVFLWINRRVPGLLLLSTGALSNGVTIAVNGGRLPVNLHAARIAGLPTGDKAFNNTAELAHPHLAWLGDTIPTPAFLPLRNVVSVGDLLIIVGAAWLVVAVCGTRWNRPWAVRVVERTAVSERWSAADAVPVPRSAEADAVEAPEHVVVDERAAEPLVAQH